MTEFNSAQDAPFAAFAGETARPAGLRADIAAAYRAPEAACIAALLPQAALPAAVAARVGDTAMALVRDLRAKGAGGPVNGLIREYDLSTEEGVALMCLAEALLRIPDNATRDALIRGKLAAGDWRGHLGHSPSLFVNAATWGLAIGGLLSADAAGLGGSLSRLLRRGGEPLIRKAVDLAMRMMGEHFVTGQTIDQALANSRAMQARGFTYSYDMLGEAAVTAADAAAYFTSYEAAIHAIGAAAAGSGIYAGPGISIKLSALHPRYARTQRARVMAELLPRVAALAALARGYGIGLNIDAEEAERLELSLDILAALCGLPALAGWDGLGFVVQAYQKRAPHVLAWLIDLARHSRRRLMLRLVKGAYWDSEIKRAQVAGLDGFPVFTRKIHTDVSYLACAKILLAARDAVFPQFATHNAQTVAAVYHMAGPAFRAGDYEFQCLHSMGETLYEAVVGPVGPATLGRPCRIYAPVGTHETLLAYLVRRLLENGANSSFVNRLHDPAVSLEVLAADPVAQAAAAGGAGHARIALPRALYGPARANAAGLDFSDEVTLADLAEALPAARVWRAGAGSGVSRPVRNPADHADVIGQVVEADAGDAAAAAARATAAAAAWRRTPAAARAECLVRAAAAMESETPALLSLLVREAGKTLPNAAAEIREAVDFLRYYAGRIEPEAMGLGVVACISPWNFPLAIFTGQIAAALAAGNAVLAKPAPETPLIAAAAVDILLAAGVPGAALQLLPGGGEVGAALVADPRVNAVVFTGSTAVARKLQGALAERLNPDGAPVPLIAETGGLNAMIVDSSALAEQVVGDVIASAFDSAGQRCSALRLLCVQVEAAPRLMAMLRGAVAELSIGPPDRLACDVGPVISTAAAARITAHIAAMRAAGRVVHQAALPAACAGGSFVAPAIVEIESIAALPGEVFGPVLHVLRYRADEAPGLIDAINALGYGLTFGVHSRIDQTIEAATAGSEAGNIYVNRNMVGAVVGVQPFGGGGLSGTGPKAGGPLYLRRLAVGGAPFVVEAAPVALTGPVGERNLYRTAPRGRVLCVAPDAAETGRQAAAAAASGNAALQVSNGGVIDFDAERFDCVLFAGAASSLLALNRRLAGRPGPIIQIHTARADGGYPLEWLRREIAVSTNTAAAGGNAGLMMLEA